MRTAIPARNKTKTFLLTNDVIDNRLMDKYRMTIVFKSLMLTSPSTVFQLTSLFPRNVLVILESSARVIGTFVDFEFDTLSAFDVKCDVVSLSLFLTGTVRI